MLLALWSGFWDTSDWDGSGTSGQGIVVILRRRRL